MIFLMMQKYCILQIVVNEIFEISGVCVCVLLSVGPHNSLEKKLRNVNSGGEDFVGFGRPSYTDKEWKNSDNEVLSEPVTRFLNFTSVLVVDPSEIGILSGALDGCKMEFVIVPFKLLEGRGVSHSLIKPKSIASIFIVHHGNYCKR